MKILPIISELFGESDPIYDVILDSKDDYRNGRTGWSVIEYRYHFITKDKIEYNVLLNIFPDQKTAKMDFMTTDLNHSGIFISLIDLINTHDAIKVFNTLKSIIERHRNEIDKLVLISTQERTKFYKKLLNYLHIKYEEGSHNGYGMLTAHLN